MPKFDYDDTVRVKGTARTWFEIPGVGLHKGPRTGEIGSIFSIREDEKEGPLERFPPGVVYGIEFGDGQAVQLHEDDLEPADAGSLPPDAI